MMTALPAVEGDPSRPRNVCQIVRSDRVLWSLTVLCSTSGRDMWEIPLFILRKMLRDIAINTASLIGPDERSPGGKAIESKLKTLANE